MLMSKIKYKVEERLVHDNRGNKRLRYVTQVVAGTRMEGDALLRHASRELNMPTWQVEGVLSVVGELLREALDEGRPVEVPHIGRFRVSIRSRATDSPKEAGAKAVTKIGVNFQIRE
mgnify:CR=1 FL=1